MSTNAIYRGRRAHVTGDYSEPGAGHTGIVIDYGDGLTFGVRFGDAALTVDPTDDEWFAASPMLGPLPGPFVDVGDGTRAIVRNVPAEPDPFVISPIGTIRGDDVVWPPCVHCGVPGESGTVDELGAAFCETCADAAVYGALCANCGRVPSERRCAE